MTVPTDAQVIAEFMGQPYPPIAQYIREIERKLAEAGLGMKYSFELMEVVADVTVGQFAALMTATDAQRIAAAARVLREIGGK